MNKKMKSTFVVLTTLAFLMAVLPMVYADVCVGESCNADINLTIGNTAPTINYVEPVSAITLNGGTTKVVTVVFNATDENGYADLNFATAQVNLSKGGETTRTSSSCGAIQNATSESTISCVVTMQFYDSAGADWVVTASISDGSSSATNDTTTATVNSLDYVTSDTTQVGWASATLGANDVEADNTITLTNGGNQNYAVMNVKGQNAVGQVFSDVINANKFSVDNVTGATSGQFYMISNTNVDVSAKLSLNTHSASSTEEIFFYVDVPNGIRADNYLSSSAWAIALS